MVLNNEKKKKRKVGYIRPPKSKLQNNLIEKNNGLTYNKKIYEKKV